MSVEPLVEERSADQAADRGDRLAGPANRPQRWRWRADDDPGPPKPMPRFWRLYNWLVDYNRY